MLQSANVKISPEVSWQQMLPRFLAVYLPLALFTVGMGVWYVHERYEIVLAHVRAEAEHHVEGQLARIRRFYRDGLLVVRGFARDSAVLPALDGNMAARAEIAGVFANILRSLDILEQLRLLDEHGHEVVRVERRDGRVRRVPEHELQDKSHRDYVRRMQGHPPGSVYVSPLDVNMEHGRIERPYRAMVRFGSVVGRAGRPRGFLVANVSGMRLMQPALGETHPPGEHLLIHAGSNWWFDRHGKALAAWEGEENMLVQHGLDGGWHRLLAAGHGQVMEQEALLTMAQFRPDGVRGISPVMRPPSWQVVSYVPLSQVRASVPAAPIWMAVATILILLGGVCTLWARYRAFQHASEQQRKAMERTRLRLLHRLFHLREEERARLSRLMHDEISQRLTAIQMRAAAVASLCSDTVRDYRKAHEGVERIREEAAELVNIVRGQLAAFRPPPLRELGLDTVIRDYCRRWSDESGVACEVEVDAAANALPGDCQIQLYRVVQEVLTNVARHAQASCAQVELQLSNGEVRLRVSDDGRGFDPAQAMDGLGLAGMRERAQLLHGVLQIDTAEGRGTAVELRAPVPARGEENPHS